MTTPLITLAEHLPAFKHYIPPTHQQWVDVDRVRTLGIPCTNLSDEPVLSNTITEETVIALRSTLATAAAEDFINIPTYLKMAWLETSRRMTLFDTMKSREDLIDSTLIYISELESVDVSELIYEQTDLLNRLMPKVNIQGLTERIMSIYMEMSKLIYDSDLILTSPAIAEAVLYQVGLLDVDPVDFVNRLIAHLVFKQNL
ncbi:MAG: hypothetical protein CMF37_15600 [Leeuwenhoekiella sp.]|jgi:hypothetical protein|nr:hypothetical protein [Leeuwenhoekiella sp.]MBH14338.1 hypothetical protein [Leeuwenhoekiella sp.]MBQ50154.1 hypothetical protein [Leeuwenhoekiella sp.]MBQ50351.1 hypothetical protein [Leeuwenhoekiella sp.]MBQ50548.1 hypothetical protein [Leeuwenhoekiella sp.]|tara:strand:- start:1484 stop:2086 length:603 start_codon:yes stop_codon:yes gene_type:complete